MEILQTGLEKETEKEPIEKQLVKPVVFAILILILLDFLMGTTYTKNAWVIAGIITGCVLFALSHSIPALQFGKQRFLYLVLYHILLASVLIFAVATPSYYLFIWVMLAYFSEYYYQARGVAISLAVLLLTLIASSYYQHQPLANTDVWAIFSWFVMLTLIILMLSRVMLGNRTERRKLSDKVIHAEYEHERMVNLINSMTDAVLTMNEKGTITTFNAAAMDLLDTNLELNGKNIDDILHLYDAQKQPVSALKIAQETHYLQRRSDLTLSFGKDDEIALELNISRTDLRSALSRKQGFTLLLRDISQQKSLDEERDDFISVVSHELRTPITIAEANVSMAELLATKPDKKLSEIKDALAKAHKQVLFLSEMVNDLSTLSRAERTDKEMEIETFDIGEVLSELASTYQPQAKEKSLYLKLEQPPVLPKITTSRLYLKEILQNFVTNAIKYTNKGGVTISVRLLHKVLIISVIDTGLGIAKSEQDNVFDKFWRSEDPLTRQNNGTGLGLYITSKLIHRIGAQVDLHSEPKQGTTFSLILPFVAVQDIDKRNIVEKEVENILG